MENKKIGFIGAGNMAAAMVGGLISNGHPADLIYVSNPTAQKREYFAKQYHVNVLEENTKLTTICDVIVLSIKPNSVQSVCHEIRNQWPSTTLIISIAAGITIDLLEKWLHNQAAIVRSMPNTPAMVNAGATGLYANAKVNAAQKDLAESIFRAIGIVQWVDVEEKLDVITALSGSGPAYLFYIMEAMQETAQSLGLSAETAQLFTEQMVLGTARLSLASDKSIKELRDSVTSPKGTTAAALDVLQTQQVQAIFHEAMSAACARAKSLAKEQQ